MKNQNFPRNLDRIIVKYLDGKFNERSGLFILVDLEYNPDPHTQFSKGLMK